MKLSAKQFKNMVCNSTAEERATLKFQKAAHLTGKSLRKLSDSWDKRGSSSTLGFYDAKKAREIKRGAV